MTLNLSEKKITESYQQLRNGRIDWVTLGYNNTKNILNVNKTGSGGLDELRNNLTDSIQFGIFRLLKETEPTIVLIQKIDSEVTPLFPPFHILNHLLNQIICKKPLLQVSNVRRAHVLAHGRQIQIEICPETKAVVTISTSSDLHMKLIERRLRNDSTFISHIDLNPQKQKSSAKIPTAAADEISNSAATTGSVASGVVNSSVQNVVDGEIKRSESGTSLCSEKSSPPDSPSREKESELQRLTEEAIRVAKWKRDAIERERALQLQLEKERESQAEKQRQMLEKVKSELISDKPFQLWGSYMGPNNRYWHRVWIMIHGQNLKIYHKEPHFGLKTSSQQIPRTVIQLAGSKVISDAEDLYLPTSFKLYCPGIGSEKEVDHLFNFDDKMSMLTVIAACEQMSGH
ncbi:hypothetical protein HK098_001893 [Nowakowskiella sp. JEL0407]|nr:hypothetical protein HK098_001893 [Nowakowskiella sp. JEL0407]